MRFPHAQSWTPLVLCLVIFAGCKETDSPVGGAPGGDGAAAAGDDASGLDPIHIVAFDEHDETLQAIIDGEMYGTVVQNPYMYGYKSIELMAQIANGKEVTAEEEFIDYPARQIRQDDALAFWEDKNEKLNAGAGDAEQDPNQDTYAYVTNGIDPFWTIAAAGAKAAAREHDVNVLLRYPADPGAAGQKPILEALLVQDDVKGVAVSPIDPANQQEILNRIGQSKIFITHDSDAPQTNRLAYIGMNNYDAGRMAGQLVKEAIPDGGEVVIFVGRLGQLNAEQRRQGVIDELLGRSPDPARRDPPSEVLEGDKYTILATLTDDFDKVRAKQNAQDAISKYPDLACMVGLFAYNPPLCLQAVREAGREVRAASE